MVVENYDLSDVDDVKLFAELSKREEFRKAKHRGDKIKEKIKSDKSFDKESYDSINESIAEHNKGQQGYHRLPTVQIADGVKLDILVYEINGKPVVVKVVTKVKNSDLDVEVIT